MTEDNKKPNAKTQSIPSSVNPDAKPAESQSQSGSPDFWRGHRVERVGGTLYLENEAGVEAFTPDQAEAYALAILLELHSEETES